MPCEEEFIKNLMSQSPLFEIEDEEDLKNQYYKHLEHQNDKNYNSQDSTSINSSENLEEKINLKEKSLKKEVSPKIETIETIVIPQQTFKLIKPNKFVSINGLKGLSESQENKEDENAQLNSSIKKKNPKKLGKKRLKDSINKSTTSSLKCISQNNEKKIIFRPKKRKKHDNKAMDNKIQSAKSFMNDCLLKLANILLNDPKKKLLSINSEQAKNYHVDFNQSLLEKNIGEVLSAPISGKNKNCEKDHNKLLIKETQNDKAKEFFNKKYKESFDYLGEYIRKKEYKNNQDIYANLLTKEKNIINKETEEQKNQNIINLKEESIFKGLENIYDNNLKKKKNKEILEDTLKNFVEIINNRKKKEKKEK